jgi:hypothetical protein
MFKWELKKSSSVLEWFVQIYKYLLIFLQKKKCKHSRDKVYFIPMYPHSISKFDIKASSPANGRAATADHVTWCRFEPLSLISPRSTHFTRLATSHRLDWRHFALMSHLLIGQVYMFQFFLHNTLALKANISSNNHTIILYSDFISHFWYDNESSDIIEISIHFWH